MEQMRALAASRAERHRHYDEPRQGLKPSLSGISQYHYAWTGVGWDLVWRQRARDHTRVEGVMRRQFREGREKYKEVPEKTTNRTLRKENLAARQSRQTAKILSGWDRLYMTL